MNQHQVEVLSNLRPETVIAAEGVSFADRALALPEVVDAEESFSEVSMAGDADTGEMIDVTAELRLEPDTQERMVVMEKFIVAGGLCYDQDSEHCNPMKDDCANGSLYHHGRRGSSGEESSFFEALGLDSYGDKDLKDERVSDQLVAHVTTTIRKNRSLMTTLSNLLRGQGETCTWDAVLKKVGDAIYQEGWEYALDYIATWFLDVSWWADVADEWKDKLDDLAGLLCESEAESAWERAIAAGTIGNPLAVLLDIYEHGGIVYSISGGGMQCRWDTTRGGAIWVPDDDAEENIRYNVLHRLGIGEVKWFGACGSKDDPLNARYSLDGGNTWVGNFAKWSQAMDAMVAASGRTIDPAELARLLSAEAEKYCKGVLEAYNAWVNGEVYGVVVYVIDRQTGERIEAEDDECWGYIGGDYAEETLEDTILNTVMRLGAVKH